MYVSLDLDRDVVCQTVRGICCTGFTLLCVCMAVLWVFPGLPMGLKGRYLPESEKNARQNPDVLLCGQGGYVARAVSRIATELRSIG